MTRLQTLIAKIQTPSVTPVPRAVFGGLAALMALITTMRVVSWRAGNDRLVDVAGSCGILFLMVFFSSRHRQVRLFAYVCAALLLLTYVAADLHHLAQRFL